MKIWWAWAGLIPAINLGVVPGNAATAQSWALGCVSAALLWTGTILCARKG